METAFVFLASEQVATETAFVLLASEQLAVDTALVAVEQVETFLVAETALPSEQLSPACAEIPNARAANIKMVIRFFIDILCTRIRVL